MPLDMIVTCLVIHGPGYIHALRYMNYLVGKITIILLLLKNL